MALYQRVEDDKRVRLITKEEKAEMKDLYLNKGWGAWRIAKTMHISAPTVVRYIEEEGIKRSKEEMYEVRSQHIEVKFTEEEVDAIVEKYENGTSIYKLRKELKLSNKPIVKALKKRGVKVRTRLEAKALQKAKGKRAKK